MVNYCCITDCQTRRLSNVKCSLFKFPKCDYLRNEWIQIVNKINGKLTKPTFVCEKHFDPENVIRSYSLEDLINKNEVDYVPRRKKPRLRENTIPSIFKNINENKTDEPSYSQYRSGPLSLLQDLIREEVLEAGQDILSPQTPDSLCEKELIWSEENSCTTQSEHIDKTLLESEFTYQNKLIDSLLSLQLYLEYINLPSGWNLFSDKTGLSFYFLKHGITSGIKLEIEKQIVFTHDSKINYYVNNKLLEKQNDDLFNLAYAFQTQDLERTLSIFSSKCVCVGGPSKIDYPGITDKYGEIDSNNIWYHSYCPKIVEPNKERCNFCTNLVYRFSAHKLDQNGK
ncbi:Zinc finger, C2CH-type [Cinara cedri]|uniref:Zinc finger, C2CH-type n=1 Tax=Cinara cedri TaxID=506608 RepID=A0A5E4MUH1_9HEMI|nr:Zinc finger, C2CH-type [Cinara cedri]